ncbi:TPA: DUF551 domain-containing protein [Enterobacter hormaechei subsp. xiangfangensis]
MSNIDKQAVQAVADLKAGYTLGNADVAILNELARIALASLEAEKGAEPVAKVETVGVCWYADNGVPRKPAVGAELFTAPPAPVAMKDHQIRDLVNELRDIAVEYYGTQQLRERIAKTVRAAMLQGADEKPELTVWYGSMPESNGKANWTAILHRKGEGRCMDGFTIDRSEYPGRVLYAADRVRYLIGEKSERPSILDYDADAHSGCVKTGNSPVVPDTWVACSERMPDIGTEIFYFCQDDGQRDCGIVSSSNFSGRGDAQLYVHAEGYDLRFGVDITHWMPLPAAPQQGDSF